MRIPLPAVVWGLQVQGQRHHPAASQGQPQSVAVGHTLIARLPWGVSVGRILCLYVYAQGSRFFATAPAILLVSCSVPMQNDTCLQEIAYFKGEEVCLPEHACLEN